MNGLKNMWMHTSCNDGWYHIREVYIDFNGTPCLEIELWNPNDFIDSEEQDENDALINNAQFIFPKDQSFILTDVPYEIYYDHDTIFIRCHTPGNGCTRCTKSFTLHREKNDYHMITVVELTRQPTEQ